MGSGAVCDGGRRVLKHASTHLDVNVRTASPMADQLQKHDKTAALLARNARPFYDQVLTLEMASKRWADVLSGFNARFNGGGSVRAAVSTFARFDSDRPWAAFDAATVDELTRWRAWGDVVFKATNVVSASAGGRKLRWVPMPS